MVLDAFTRDILSSKLNTDPPPDDVSTFFSLYNFTIRTLVDKHVPTKDVLNRRSRLCSPWFIHRCRATRRATRCLDRRYRRTHTADDYRLWRAHHDHQRQVFQAEYAAYWSSAIDRYPDLRSLWNRMNSLLRPVASTSVTHIADDFSTFFLRERLPPFVLQQQPLQHQRLSTDRFLHSLASIM